MMIPEVRLLKPDKNYFGVSKTLDKVILKKTPTFSDTAAAGVYKIPTLVFLIVEMTASRSPSPTQLLVLMVMIRLRAAREMIIFKVVMILIP